MVCVVVGDVRRITILNSRKVEISYRGVKKPTDKHTEIKRGSPKEQSSYCLLTGGPGGPGFPGGPVFPRLPWKPKRNRQ